MRRTSLCVFTRALRFSGTQLKPGPTASQRTPVRPAPVYPAPHVQASRLLHLKSPLNAAHRVRRNPHVISSRRNNPTHFGIMRPEIIRIDDEFHCPVFSSFERDPLKAFQL